MASYDLGKSLQKAAKYPIATFILSGVLKLLDIAIAGFKVQLPEGAQVIVDHPEIAFGFGLVILIYDWLKHKEGLRLP
jgi:hypothetical protein